MDAKSLEDLLAEQRTMVQKCVSAAKQCLEMNQAIAAKVASNEKVAKVPGTSLSLPVDRSFQPQGDGAGTPSGVSKAARSFGTMQRGVTVPTSNTTPLLEDDIGELRRVTSDPDLNSDKKNMFGAPAKRPLSMRDRVMEALKKHPYNVEDYYKETGCAQALARWEAFQNLTLGVIAMNAIWIAVETDYNKATIITEAPLVFRVVDNAFCAYYSFEILIRFMAFREKRCAFRDGWFNFDLVLVFLMVLETWIEPIVFQLMGGKGQKAMGKAIKHMSIFRLFRLLRLARIGRLVRLLRSFPELLVLTKAMMYALRSLGATCALLCLTIYVFALVFTQVLSATETGKDKFETVPQSFNTLLMTGVFTEQREMIDVMLDGSFAYYALIIFYLLVASFTVLNMLIGVICEVIAEVAAREKEDILLQDLKQKMGQICQLISGVSMTKLVRSQSQPDCEEEPTMISREMFMGILESEEACQVLDEVGVDVVSLAELSEFAFPKEGSLELTEFLQLILQFRGSNQATVKDLVDMRRFMVEELKMMKDR